MDLYGAAIRHVLVPAWESAIARRPTLSYLRFLEKSQWRSYDEVMAIQAGALKRLVEHLYARVPHYQRIMKERGLTPGDIASPDDLVKLPVLSRAHAQATVEDRTAAWPPIAVRKSTSGTTGSPMTVAYDADSEHWRQAVKWRGYGWAGYRMGDASFHYWAPPAVAPKGLKRAKITVDRLLKREYYESLNIRSEQAMAHAARRIAEVEPKVLLCYAQAGGDLARFVLERGLKKWQSIPVICGAERLFEHDRKAIDEAFAGGVFETYGCREFMLIAAECPAHEGMHISVENLVVEVLVREGEGYRVAGPGELGELAITDLHNYAQPLVRHTNGDLGILAKVERCRCGSALPKLASVEGRITETLTDANGARISSLFFSVIFVTLGEAVKQFQVVQHPDKRITVRVVPSSTFNDDSRRLIIDKAAASITGVTVNVETVSEIPLTPSGKRKIVIVET